MLFLHVALIKRIFIRAGVSFWMERGESPWLNSYYTLLETSSTWLQNTAGLSIAEGYFIFYFALLLWEVFESI